MRLNKKYLKFFKKTIRQIHSQNMLKITQPANKSVKSLLSFFW